MRNGLRACPWGLFFALGAIFGIERSLARNELEYALDTAWDWRLGAKAAETEARDAEILLLGDSQIKVGVAAKIVESRIGGKVVSLARNGGQSPASYYLLKRALEAGAKPKAIVVEFMPALLAKDARYNDRQWPELLRFGESIRLALSARDAGFLAAVCFGRAFPSLRGRHDLKSYLRKAFDGQNPSCFEQNVFYARQWRLNAGSQILAEWPNRTDPSAWFEDAFGRPWSSDPSNADFADRLLDLAFSKGIAVVWLIPPLNPRVSRLIERSGADAPIRKFVEERRRKYPRLIVLDAERSGYEDGVFTDMVHLNRRGAICLSLDVARFLRKIVAGESLSEHRIDLPTYRDRSSEIQNAGIEDLGQSMEIVKQALATKKTVAR